MGHVISPFHFFINTFEKSTNESLKPLKNPTNYIKFCAFLDEFSPTSSYTPKIQYASRLIADPQVHILRF